MNRFSLIGIFLINSAFATGSVYQYGTPHELLLGQYNAITTAGNVIKQANFGIGAGVGLGELIIVDGKAYLADPHGNTRLLQKSDGLCYVTATDFKPTIKFSVKAVNSFTDLEHLVQPHFTNQDLFYAIKIKGKFTQIDARSENIDHEPYTPIVTWMKTNQNTFSVKNVDATVVLFYNPSYLNQIGVDWHAHFITDDGKTGGHIFNLKIQQAEVSIMQMSNIDVKLRTKFAKTIKANASDSSITSFHNVVEKNTN